MIEVLLGSGFIVALILGLALALLAARARLIPDTALRVRVNDVQTIEARRGAKLLEVLHGANIPIPAACGGNGTCGQCRVVATGEGAGELRSTELGLLSARERRNNVRLACQVALRGSVDVTVPPEIMSAETFTATVVSNRMLAPLIRELVLKLPEEKELAFRAGGFMLLTAPPYDLDFSSLEIDDAHEETWRISGWSQLRSQVTERTARAYSIATRPADRNLLVHNIRLAVPPAGREEDIPPGIVSSYLFGLKPGSELDVSGPFGEFHVQPTEEEMVFIGGGVGMAPLRAMIHEQLALGTKRRISYFYGARSRADLFYAEEFEALASEHGNFSWTVALSDPAPGERWQGETGFIHEVLARTMRNHPRPEDCEYYLCGPPVMISAVLSTLDDLGVEPHSIFNDDFGI
ncbi:NADH:ubiquinone reductase (Na(+)-transporting) subunit F [Aquamicrobium zhengzhouense]|uniref:Na(+)-translocating NADH-quinone reductase subunit F n=1 Tax=Aquamicrobium zhengzhouense TaxID=2781738 RepID=A0ABS0SBY5_9HYPH|nr:NADH:ubiquinone reductase (Na(+)-transporting) subunit F [Aquamicrobium zhengzhouense]MBI1620819.1 NADH:ubiquinone reductase (Na(+)-transporting) subunit F [Aquamicrobium zhengzhouense]